MPGRSRRSHRYACGVSFLVAILALPPSNYAQESGWRADATLRGGLVNDREDSERYRVLVPTLQAAYSSSGPKTGFGFNGWVSTNLADDNPSPQSEDVRYGLGVSLRKTLSERVRLNSHVGYSTGPNVESLFVTSVALSDFDLETLSAGLGMSYDASERTTIGVTATGIATRYRQYSASSSADLPGEVLAPADSVAPLGTPIGPTDPAFGLDNTPEGVALLAAEGVTEPKLDYWNARFGFNINHQINSSHSLMARFGYRLIERQTEPTGRSNETDLTVLWSHQLSDSAQVGASVSSYGDGGDGVYVSRTLAINGSKTLSPAVQVSGWIGPSYGRGLQEGTGEEISSWDPVGGVGVSVAKERIGFAANYSRTRYRTLVVGGSYLTDALYMSLSSRLTQDLFFGLYVSLRNSSDQGALQDPNLPGLVDGYRSSLAGVVLQKRLNEKISLGVNYSSHSYNGDSFFDEQRSSLTIFVKAAIHRGRPSGGGGRNVLTAPPRPLDAVAPQTSQR